MLCLPCWRQHDLRKEALIVCRCKKLLDIDWGTLVVDLQSLFGPLGLPHSSPSSCPPLGPPTNLRGSFLQGNDFRERGKQDLKISSHQILASSPDWHFSAFQIKLAEEHLLTIDPTPLISRSIAHADKRSRRGKERHCMGPRAFGGKRLGGLAVVVHSLPFTATFI